MNFKETIKLDLIRHNWVYRGLNEPLSSLGLLKLAFSPRFMPVLLCRVSCKLNGTRFSLIGKLFSAANAVVFGIEVASQVKIGGGLILPHTQGTVIGAYEIGVNTIIYQGVTLGAKHLDSGFSLASRPSLGNGVVLGAGSKVIGGVHIGDNVVVAANSVVLNDVSSGETVAGVPAYALKAKVISRGE